MEEIVKQRKELIMAEIMPPERANFTGHIHGGYIVLLLDRVAYACTSRYCGKSVVTVSIDEVLFKKSIFIGDLVTFYASINYVGRTSMVVGIRVTAENLKTGEVRHTNTCYITMVAIDDQGNPTPVPKLILNNDTDRRRYKEAEELKQLRKEYQLKMAAVKLTKD
ncbi:MAG: acyl-CoA thioesterase [Gammaproteobacteria bacterium RIFCSPHIGHO2_12_FULL_35_23]|nr:MAG: acyl-CoA thioesterase [Gammaproteobacteria bacterium RIFCSPHIGHO2_12_FULL_35_23]